jgi:hypothetical protein
MAAVGSEAATAEQIGHSVKIVFEERCMCRT